MGSISTAAWVSLAGSWFAAVAATAMIAATPAEAPDLLPGPVAQLERDHPGALAETVGPPQPLVTATFTPRGGR
jgi:hypothetical protein